MLLMIMVVAAVAQAPKWQAPSPQRRLRRPRYTICKALRASCLKSRRLLHERKQHFRGEDT